MVMQITSPVGTSGFHQTTGPHRASSPKCLMLTPGSERVGVTEKKRDELIQGYATLLSCDNHTHVRINRLTDRSR